MARNSENPGGHFRNELELVIMALTAKTLLSKLNRLPASALLDDRLLEKLLNSELSSAILNEALQRDLLTQRLNRKLFSLNLIDDQKRQELISRLDISEVDEADLAEDGETDEDADIESEAEAEAFRVDDVGFAHGEDFGTSFGSPPPIVLTLGKVHQQVVDSERVPNPDICRQLYLTCRQGCSARVAALGRCFATWVTC
ncbi:hypothetical protein A9R05_41325 (plasmid) [Burkholderia sp. KK1]|nr:hypothetical protein A9R05_41325 [Burkholderia sp. KK1]